MGTWIHIHPHSKITFILLMGDIGHCNYNLIVTPLPIASLHVYFKLYIILLWVIQQAKGLTPL